MRIPLPVRSYRHRSLPISAQRLINLFPETQPADAKTQVALLSTPGLVPWVTVGNGPIRGLHVMDELLFAVSGNTVYQVRSNGNALAVGTVTIGTSPVQMADNGRQLVIVTDPQAYVCDGDSVTQITDADFPGASTVDYLDGYHIFTSPLSGQFFISALLDATSYDALDFASAESSPDPLVKVLVDHREVWLLGKHSIELWTNSGGADFPFTRQPGAVLEAGCAAAGSVRKLDNSVYFLGSDGICYRAVGYQPQRISTHALEQAWGTLRTLRDAQAIAYVQDGHSFYCLTLPGAGTWCYDAATGEWHERQSYGQTEWRAAGYAHVYGRRLVGDRSSGAIYELDPEAYAEGTDPQIRTADFPPLHAEGARTFLSRLELDCETGVGLADGQGANPQIALSWSDDGGKTWSNEHWASMGRIGAYRHRVRWYRLGSFRQRVCRISISDPVPVTIAAAYAEIQPGI
jgi:Phage stabilisation protein